jgi:hypothetical protein
MSIDQCHIGCLVSDLTFHPSTYRSLTPKTRALFGVGVMAWATIGLWTTPQVENALGMSSTKEELEALDKQLAVRISRVGGDEKDGRVN